MKKILRKNYPIYLLAALAISASGCIHQAEFGQLISGRADGDDLIIRNVRVFPATSTATIEHADVIVRDGVIAEVRATGGPPPAGLPVIDGAGKTLLPGLIDMHVHATGSFAPPWKLSLPSTEFNLRAYLYAGITTIYDMGALMDDLMEAREKIEAGELIGPRIISSGKAITVPDGHPVAMMTLAMPWPLPLLIVPRSVIIVSDAKSARRAIGRMKRGGVDYIKVICDELPIGAKVIDQALMDELVSEAHRLGLKVAVHIGSERDAMTAINAGADLLAHVVYKQELSDQAAKRIADSGAAVIPTLLVWHKTDTLGLNKIDFNEMERRIAPAELIEMFETAGDVRGKLPEPFTEWWQVLHDHNGAPARNTKKLYDLGVPIMVGTDTAAVGNIPGAGIHRELKMLVDAGIPPAEALLGATGRAARFLRPDPVYGTIEVGKQADLLLVEGNPLENIEDTAKISEVIKAGRIIERIK